MIIDVSKWQGVINWNKVKAEGKVDGAILRAVSTNANGLYIDATFERNYSECKRLGIPVGAYFFSYATNETILDRELILFSNAISGKSFELPLVIDVEDSSQKDVGKTRLAELIKHGLDVIESWGCYAMWYTYKSFLYYIDTDILKNYGFWLAWYTDNEPNRYTYHHQIWQNSSSGVVSGISGRVDTNIAYIDFPKVIKTANLNCLGETWTSIDTEVEIAENRTEDVPYISTEPVRMKIGFASLGDCSKIVEKLSALEIHCDVADGIIVTDKVSVGDQKTIIAMCLEKNVPYAEYFEKDTDNARYTVVNHSKVGGEEPTYNPTQIEQIISQAQQLRNETVTARNEAEEYAEQTKADADEIKETVEGFDTAAATATAEFNANAVAKKTEITDTAEVYLNEMNENAVESIAEFNENARVKQTAFDEAVENAEGNITEIADSKIAEIEQINNLLEPRVSAVERNKADKSELVERDKTIKSLERDVKNLKLASEGVLYTTETDDEALREKAIKSGTLPFGKLEKIGGMSRKGKNLLNTILTEQTVAGVKFEPIYKNGLLVSLSAKGTVTSKWNKYILFRGVLGQGSYTFSKGVSIPDFFIDILRADGTSIRSSTAISISFSLSETTEVIIRTSIGADTIDAVLYPMLNEGTEALPYESYTDSLIDAKVESVESVGANLLDTSKTYLFNSNKYIATNGYTTEGQIKVKPNTTYTIMVRKRANDYKWYSFNKNSDRSIISTTTVNNDASGFIQTFVTPTDADKISFYYTFGHTYETPKECADTEKFMLIEGSFSSLISYTSHRAPIVTSIPQSIQSLDGYGIGISADCYNYVDFERKVFVKKCYKDGNEVKVLTQPIETDISDLLADFDNTLTVESGGTLRLRYPQYEDYVIDMPNTETYLVSTKGV